MEPWPKIDDNCLQREIDDIDKMDTYQQRLMNAIKKDGGHYPLLENKYIDSIPLNKNFYEQTFKEERDEDGFQKLWDEVNNHPNDPISENACKKLKQYLIELQESIKGEDNE